MLTHRNHSPKSKDHNCKVGAEKKSASVFVKCFVFWRGMLRTRQGKL